MKWWKAPLKLLSNRKHFNKSLKFVLQWEGGYINHPSDPGGETNYGISKRAYPNVDIKNITKKEVEYIYFHDYWKRADCHKIDWPTCCVIFDFAVMSGVTRAKRYYRLADGDCAKLLKLRHNYYETIVAKNPKLEVFRRGWFNRLNALKRFINVQ